MARGQVVSLVFLVALAGCPTMRNTEVAEPDGGRSNVQGCGAGFEGEGACAASCTAADCARDDVCERVDCGNATTDDVTSDSALDGSIETTPQDDLGDAGASGACHGDSMLACSGGGGDCNALAFTPQPETCNGKDDDCDGVGDAQDVASVCLGSDHDLWQSCDGTAPSMLSCKSLGKTCATDDVGTGCRGICYWGARRCVSGERAFDVCQLDGTWGTRVSCPGTTVDSSWTVCRPSGSTVDCIDSVAASNGFDTTSSWELRDLVANRWAVVPIVATSKLQVSSLDVFMGSIPAASSLQMALWDEAVNAEGKPQPGGLLARTAIIVNPSPYSLNRLTITTARPTLTIGKTYWVGVNVSQDSQIRARAGSGSVVHADLQSSSPAPHPFPVVTPQPGAELGMSLRGKDEL